MSAQDDALNLDAADPTVRAWLERQIARERERADYWAQYPDHADALAAARAAIVKYTDLLAEGSDPCPT